MELEIVQEKLQNLKIKTVKKQMLPFGTACFRLAASKLLSPPPFAGFILTFKYPLGWSQVGRICHFRLSSRHSRTSLPRFISSSTTTLKMAK
jgi:hypothetical protein